jgi:hypothetical protein
MNETTISWRRLDAPGRESCRLSSRGTTHQLAGSASFLHEGQSCRLDYVVACDSGWRTTSGSVSGAVGDRAIAIEISVDADRRWRLNGRECPEVEGCTDLDLNFSPSTNLLPIRRLGLAVGQAAAVRAAWLRFPSFALEPLDQIYRRLGESFYRYESAGGRFVVDIETAPSGFVTRYPGYWEAEAGA